MELKEFIKETLLQIITGVRDAQTESAEYDAIVNPANIEKGDVMVTHIDNNVRTVQNICFEVALASSSSEATKAGIGVMLAYIGGGINKNTDGQNSITTGIKFTIPIALPAIDNKNKASSPNISFGTPTNRHRY
ncbi:MAG TPA: hypothetical protein DEG28_00925 [Porphyromonadaceae bacterium]|nr:hypothetical protein [Porphyromonadaceae bacterium]